MIREGRGSSCRVRSRGHLKHPIHQHRPPVPATTRGDVYVEESGVPVSWIKSLTHLMLTSPNHRHLRPVKGCMHAIRSAPRMSPLLVARDPPAHRLTPAAQHLKAATSPGHSAVPGITPDVDDQHAAAEAFDTLRDPPRIIGINESMRAWRICRTGQADGGPPPRSSRRSVRARPRRSGVPVSPRT